jgi:hypothetical protein
MENSSYDNSSKRWWFKLSILFPIIVNIIIILITISLTFFLYAINQQNSYYSDMNFWCYDDFYCDTSCKIKNSSCFENSGKTGLASCLFGPTSNAVNPSENGLYICPSPVESEGNNCLNNCPLKLDDLKQNIGKYCCCSTSNNPACVGETGVCKPQ